MKKFLSVLFSWELMLAPVLANETIPKQEIQNTKGFATINYDRQDSSKTGEQRIINDHSAFNINIIIVKKGALLNQKDDKND